MMSVPLLLQHTWRLYTRNLSVLLGYVAWILVFYMGTLISDWFPASLVTSALEVIFAFLQFLTMFWASAVIMLVTSAVVHEEQVDLNRLGMRAWNRVPELAWVGLLGGLIVVGGFIALVIPGLVFLVWYTFAQTEVMLGTTRGWSALQTSRQLVEGRFWEITKRIFFGPLVLFLSYMIVTGLLMSFFSVISGTPATTWMTNHSPFMWQEVVSTVIETLTIPLFVIYSTLLYLEARQSPPSSPMA